MCIENWLIRYLKLHMYILYKQKHTEIYFHVYTDFFEVINLVLISNTAEVLHNVCKHW